MSLPRAPRTSRRVERTRHLLLNALVELMQERRFDDLTVQDLIDRAHIGRATFYAHFRNKEDLFRASVERLRDSLLGHWETGLAAGAWSWGELAFALLFFRHVGESRPIWKSLVGGEGGAIVDRQFRKMFAELARIEHGTNRSDVHAEGQIQFLVGGIMAMVHWWMDGDVTLSADELYALLRNTAAKGV